ncbi:hypothetical protein CLAIMM_10198 [Cladophialophora immunda]|nr:hypothetical protein CLAIMM_10198 [Cladophialophora immunda]
MATDTTLDTNMDVSIPTATVSEQAQTKPEKLPTTVEKPTPYTYDLGYLTATDPNPLPATSQLLAQTLSERNESLRLIARDGAQSLLNTLLTTCAIQSTPEGLIMTLPTPQQYLPRWKPLPKPKAPTKWELFARKKGIGNGEWVKKWGYQGRNKKAESEWLVELDDEAVRKEKSAADGGGEEGRTIRGEGRRERKDRIKRQERRQRNNERRSRKGGKTG